MKTRMKERMAKRRARFLVGYICSGNLVFGKPAAVLDNGVWPLTRKQAEAVLNEMPSSDCAIFELIPRAVNR